MARDIHCVISWSTLHIGWEGVAVDDILADAGITEPIPFAVAHCNVPHTAIPCVSSKND
jgi:DMSO/TMAO reductase YedYZ molybdopterin-dependent catalytic subunit